MADNRNPEPAIGNGGRERFEATALNAGLVPDECRSRSARIAGLLYLVVIAAGMFSLAYVPARIGVSADPATVLANLQASEALFRLGLAASLVCYVAFLLLPLALYRLLAPVGRTTAILMLALAVAGAALSLANVGNRLEILPLLDASSRVQALGAEQLQAQAVLSLSAYGSGLLTAKLFWGLWLFPFGLLVFKSGFLPRLLGALLMAGCVGYLIDVFGTLVFPGYSSTAISDYATLPAAIGEIGTGLWLLLVGVRSSKTQAGSVS